MEHKFVVNKHKCTHFSLTKESEQPFVKNLSTDMLLDQIIKFLKQKGSYENIEQCHTVDTNCPRCIRHLESCNYCAQNEEHLKELDWHGGDKLPKHHEIETAYESDGEDMGDEIGVQPRIQLSPALGMVYLYLTILKSDEIDETFERTGHEIFIFKK